MSKAKKNPAISLEAQKAQAKRLRFLKALFHGKLAKSRVPEAKGFRMPE